MDLCEHGISAYAGIEASHVRPYGQAVESSTHILLKDEKVHTS
jgi:hypothetical protein